MTLVQVISIAGCGVLGYWLVAVFLPLLRESKENYRENTVDPPPDADTRRPHSEESDASRWFEVLEIKEDSSAVEIAAAYRKKIREYHPDRVAQMGTEIRELAERRSIEINRAYESAMKLRGS